MTDHAPKPVNCLCGVTNPLTEQPYSFCPFHFSQKRTVSVPTESRPTAEWEFNEVVTEVLEEVLSGDEFHVAVDRIMKAAKAYAASSSLLPVQEEAVLYVVEELSPSCKVWTPVQFGSFVAEQETEALALHEQFIATYPTRQFRVARYLRDDPFIRL